MSKVWQIAVVKDTSKPMLGLHGLHTAFRGLPNVEVVAHVDANTVDLSRKLSETQAKHHYATLSEMLANESPDIVVLCPRHPGDHLEQIRQVAEKGCHIYCEKPVSVLLEEADEVARIVETTGIKLAMAHPARHDLAFRTMKHMIDAGDIGMPLSVVGRGKCDHRGGGEDLIVLGTHILDLMVYFFGASESVMGDVRVEGRAATLSDKVDTVEPVDPALGDEVFAAFSFPGGVRGIFESRQGLLKPGQPAPHMGLCVMGTAGTLSLRFDDGARQPLLLSRRTGFPETITDFEEVPLSEERAIPGAEPLDYSLCKLPDVPGAPWFMEANRFAVWDLMRAIEENRAPQSNIENARLVVEMIQGIYAAHLSRRAVGFPLSDRTHSLLG
jgi:predicted dehydrogenase